MAALLRATVLASKNTTKHYLGIGADAVELPVPFRVTIMRDDSGIFLLRECTNGQVSV